MKKIPQNFMVLIVSVIVIGLIAAIFGGFLSEPTMKQDGKIYVAQIQAENYNKDVYDYLKISDMPPNSMAGFYYPDSADTTNRDFFYLFILIRLPEELGGNQNDVSAFRAYSALSINSHCVMKYWPTEGRKRIEDPCHGDVIRPQDGFLLINSNPIKSGVFVAQPYLKLSSDSEGYLYAEQPSWEMNENGVVGIGRNISPEIVKNGAISDFKNFVKEFGNNLEIPYVLSDDTVITPGMDKGQFIYRHIQDSRLQHSLGLSYCNCTDKINYQGQGSHLFSTWNLGNDRVYTDEWSREQMGFDLSVVTIFRDGYEIAISGSSLDKTLDLVFADFYEDKNRSMLEKVFEIRRD